MVVFQKVFLSNFRVFSINTANYFIILGNNSTFVLNKI